MNAIRKNQQVWNAGQSWNYQSLLVDGNVRLRVSIRRNSYDEQCHCRIDVFSHQTNQWNLLYTLPLCLCRSAALNYVQNQPKHLIQATAAFQEDEAELFRLASIVLGLGITPTKRQ